MTRVYVRGVILVREDVRFSGSPASVLLEVSLEHLLSLIKLNSFIKIASDNLLINNYL